MRMLSFYRTTVGKKAVVAVTGAILFLFLVGHMVGNLKAFAGVDPTTGIQKLDLYAKFLRDMGHEFAGHSGLLWIFRLGLIGAIALHVVTIIQLQLRNAESRPVDYVMRKSRISTPAARTMFWGGIIILIFAALHLLHFTFGSIHYDGFVHGHVYANIYASFKHAYITVPYLIAMVVVGMHLYHGVWSMFQTLGLDAPSRNAVLRALAAGSAFIITIGFAAVPIAIITGVLPEPAHFYTEPY